MIRMEEAKQQKISRRKLPDGTYDKKPLDPEYFKKYYHSHGLQIITCYRCGAECRKNYLSKHMNTSKRWKELSKFLANVKTVLPELDF